MADQQNEEVTANVTEPAGNAATQATVADQATAETERAQSETNARLALDSIGVDNVDFEALGNIDIAALINSMLEGIQNGENMFDAFKNSISEAVQGLKGQEPAAEEPEAGEPEAQTQVAEAPDTAEPQAPQQEEPKGYVNEGQGPLLTTVDKPAEPPISSMIDYALRELDEPSDQNILGGAFNKNAAYEVSDAQVVQVPFAPEPLVANPQAQPMEVTVAEPAVNDEEFTQSAPAAMKLG